MTTAKVPTPQHHGALETAHVTTPPAKPVWWATCNRGVYHWTFVRTGLEALQAAERHFDCARSEVTVMAVSWAGPGEIA